MTIANLNNDLLIWSKIQVYKYTNFYFLFIHTVSIHRIVNKAIIEEEEEEEVNFKRDSWRESEQNRDRSISSTFDFVRLSLKKKKKERKKEKSIICVA